MQIRIILSSVALFVLLIGQATAANVHIISKTVNPGETFDLIVSIEPNGTAISGGQLNLAFNNSIININSISEGNLFKQKGASTFFNSGIINNSSGTVVNIFGVIIGPNNVSNSGSFIIINATAVGSTGTSLISLYNVIICNPEGVAIPLNVVNGSVNINSAPVLAAIGNKIVNEGQKLTFTLSASDANGDALTYSASNLPPGATFYQANGTFQWTPNFTQSGTYSNMNFEVSDGSLTDFENIMITVNNVKKSNGKNRL